jgi:hypothetical protein
MSKYIDLLTSVVFIMIISFTYMNQTATTKDHTHSSNKSILHTHQHTHQHTTHTHYHSSVQSLVLDYALLSTFHNIQDSEKLTPIYKLSTINSSYIKYRLFKPPKEIYLT